jgi:hypothetical protein
VATTTTLDSNKLLENILNEYVSIPFFQDNVTSEIIIDANKHRYFLLTMGWIGDRRIHHVSVDIEIRGDKFWIHYDGTEDGIAVDLERVGIPKERIVLAWHPEEVRHLTEYAVN